VTAPIALLLVANAVILGITLIIAVVAPNVDLTARTVPHPHNVPPVIEGILLIGMEHARDKTLTVTDGAPMDVLNVHPNIM